MNANHYNNNFNDDLDWVQAPPQGYNSQKAYKGPKRNRRKGSSKYSKKNKKYYNGGYYDYHDGYSNSQYYPKGSESNFKNSNPKNRKYSDYVDSQCYKVCYNQFEELSTDASDESSPDRLEITCMNMKVQVLGEVVIDKINPRFNHKRRRNNRFAAACELKAPEPTEIASPKFIC